MNFPDTHLVLVSDQPVPSLLPLLDARMGARKAILVATPTRQEPAHWLAEALRAQKLEVEIIALNEPYDFPRLHSIFRAQIHLHPEGIAANISGGNKLMSIAAYEGCKAAEQPVYYINIESDAVQWLYPEGQPNHPLQASLRLENYLLSCGVKVLEISRDEVDGKEFALATAIQQAEATTICSDSLLGISRGSAIPD